MQNHTALHFRWKTADHHIFCGKVERTCWKGPGCWNHCLLKSLFVEFKLFPILKIFFLILFSFLSFFSYFFSVYFSINKFFIHFSNIFFNVFFFSGSLVITRSTDFKDLKNIINFFHLFIMIFLIFYFKFYTFHISYMSFPFSSLLIFYIFNFFFPFFSFYQCLFLNQQILYPFFQYLSKSFLFFWLFGYYKIHRFQSLKEQYLLFSCFSKWFSPSFLSIFTYFICLTSLFPFHHY